MVIESKKPLKELHNRLVLLKHLCCTLGDENEALRSRMEEKDQTIATLRSELNEMTAKYQNQKIAQSIAQEDGSVKAAKGRFNKLVREIDKCISLLNE